MLARGFISHVGLDPETIYAKISLRLLPEGMMGLMVAALFAATMSVIASGYNVVAAVLTLDVYQRLIRREAKQRELVLVGRVLSATVGLIVLGIALTVTRSHWTIFDTMVAVFGFLLPPTVLPMLAGLLSRRLTAAGALLGFVAGAGTGTAFAVYRSIGKPAMGGSFQAMSIIVPAVFTGLVLYASARFMPNQGEAHDRAQAFFTMLEQPTMTSESSVTSPAPIVGVVIGIMGAFLLLIPLHAILTHGEANRLTVGMGSIFTITGMLLIFYKRLTQGPSPGNKQC